METLVFEPFFPLPVLAAFWVLSLGAVLFYIFVERPGLSRGRRIVTAMLHLPPLAGLLLLLHGPTWVRLSRDGAGKPALRILADLSASMATPDGEGGRSRWAEVRERVNQAYPGWAEAFAPDLTVFEQVSRRVTGPEALAGIEAGGSGTDLAGALRAALSSGTPGAILVFSDGIHNAQNSSLGEAALEARAAGVPVFTSPAGAQTIARDLGLALSGAEELAFVRQRVKVPVTLIQTGLEEGTATLELSQGGQVIESRAVPIKAQEARQTVEFHLSRDKPGLYLYEVRVPPFPGEALLANNRRRFTLRVVDEKIRVLFLEGRPFWDSKFLFRILRRDPNVELTTAVRMAPGRVILEGPGPEEGMGAKEDKGGSSGPGSSPPAVPSSKGWFGPRDPARPLEDPGFLARFQVVMLGGETEEFFSGEGAANVKDWVARAGGYLVCARGRPFPEKARVAGALASVMPVSWKDDAERRFRVELTERGRATSLFDLPAGDGNGKGEEAGVVLKTLPSLVTATRIIREGSLTVVLARAHDPAVAEPMAVLAVQPYGNGKSVILEGQGLWRWGFRPPQDPLRGEDLFRSFWANMVRWLAGGHEFLPGQETALRAGKPSYEAGETASLYFLRKSGAEGEASGVAAGAPPEAEVIREDESGSRDPAFRPLRATFHPLPRERLVWKAELGILEEGHYRAYGTGGQAKAEAAFEVLAPLRERLDLRARPEALEALSQGTGGRKLEPGELSRLPEFFREFTRKNRSGKEVKRPAWDRPLFLGLFLAWMAWLWWWRRRFGAI